jgi:hypothetical protein
MAEQAKRFLEKEYGFGSRNSSAPQEQSEHLQLGGSQ